MIIEVDEEIRLETLNDDHAVPVFRLIEENRLFLRRWLNFVDNMKSEQDLRDFIIGSKLRTLEKLEFTFVIFQGEQVIGRIGVYRVDQQNKIGEIGYWLPEDQQGKGIISRCCKILIPACFDQFELNRIEIKCAFENQKSRSIPEKLGFKNEGTLREAGMLNGEFVDLVVYSLLRKEYQQT